MPVHRLFALLQCIPRLPDAISPRYLAQRVSDRFEIDAYLPIEVSADTAKKRMQRDLAHLQQLLGPEVLHCDRTQRQRPLYALDADLVLPGQDPDLAVIWQTLSQLGALAAPPVVVNDAERRTKRAARHLTSAQGHWQDKVRLRSRLWLPEPPEIDRTVLRTVQQALFEDRQLLLGYMPRGTSEAKTYGYLHPLMLLIRDGVVYLVARHEQTVKQFALHRMCSVKVLPDPCHRHAFHPDEWLAAHADPGDEPGLLRWVLRVSDDLADHLCEQPVGTSDQWSECDASGRRTLITQMPYSERLVWWLLGLGANIEVTEPVEVRDEMRQRLEQALSHYQADAAR